MWIVYKRTINQDNHTNNHAETENRRIELELGMGHSKIWKLIDFLKVRRGETFIMSNFRKYRDVDERIITLVANFGERDILIVYAV